MVPALVFRRESHIIPVFPLKIVLNPVREIQVDILKPDLLQRIDILDVMDIHIRCRVTEEINSSARDYDPSRITRYVYDVATLFHKFYNACRVKNENASLMQARLALCLAVKTVISNILEMFKIDAPESM